MFTDFHFLRPWCLLALLLVPVVYVLVVQSSRGLNRWANAIAPELLAVLMDDTQTTSRKLAGPLIIAAYVLGTLAVAGPTWERLPTPVERENDALVIVLDLSLSMYVQDVQPSRIERAKHKVTDILRARDQGFIALVAYAGDAHTVAPLTDDTRTVQNLLLALYPGMMPVFGSNPGHAIDIARSLFENAGFPRGRILVITDGIDRVADVTQYAHPDYPISILGVGTEGGGPIPLDFVDQPGQVFRNDQGVVVNPKLDGDRLESIAEVCHGRYRDLDVADTDIRYLLATPLPEEAETVRVEREFDAWHDVGYWLVVPLAGIALFAFRKGAIAALVLVAAIAVEGPAAHAGLWDDIWQRRDQQAYDALRSGEADTATALFKDDKWRAVAQYRNHDYRAAAEGFELDGSTAAEFNLGNSHANMGSYIDAIAAYDRVLEREPGHEDAAFNKALVERLLEEQQQEQSQGEGETGGDESDAESSPQPGDEGDQASQENEGEPPDSEQSDQEQDGSEQDGDQDADMAAREERESADANEQWLRRVPDDPGGLLQRKFKYETNQRLRSGDYSNRQGERLW